MRDLQRKNHKMYRKQKLYFSKYNCMFCKQPASSQCVATTSDKFIIICDKEDCRKKAKIKLKFFPPGIKIKDKYEI